MRRSGLVATVLAVIAAAQLINPQPVRANESPLPTIQQRSYGADWLAFLDPAELPPVDQRAIVCLVDSGVAVNDDLPADRPEGPVITRRSIIDGEDATPGSAPENQHGTYMALMIGALHNNTGTIGAVPWARIASVKAMSAHEHQFTPAAYVNGMRECREEVHGPIASVSVSIGCGCQPTDAEVTRVRTEVAFARSAGALVIASAGNRPGEPPGYPASERGVIAVAAGDADAALCDYASYGSQALVGPGCDIDSAEDGEPVRTTGGGSSSAAAFTSALVAAVKTFVPAATSAELETWLRQGARFVDDHPVVDAEGMFRAAGLGDLVDRAKAREALMAPPAASPQNINVAMPPAAATSTPTAPVTTHPISRTQVAPLTSAHWRSGKLTVAVVGRRDRTRLQIALERRSTRSKHGYATIRVVTRDASRVSVAARTPPDRLRIRLFPPDRRGGPAIYLHRLATGAFR